jgi:signal transduction histidine kinase
MPARVIDLLVVTQTALLAISYACLFQFGVRLLQPLSDPYRLVSLLPALLIAVWMFVAIGPTWELAADVDDWHRMNSIWSRYTLCFPGALVAAYALLLRSGEIDRELASPGISRPLQIGAFALVGYAFFSGLFVPRGNTLPASWLNDELVRQTLVLPVEVFRSAMGAILAIGVIRGLEVFQVELDRIIFGMEQEKVLTSERMRISRDLHDHTLQKVYAAGLVLRSAGEPSLQSASAGQLLAQGLQLLDAAVTDIRAFIGGLDGRQAQCTLASGLEDLRDDAGYRSLVRVVVEHNLSDDCALAVGDVTHLLAIANEAVSNAVRHANASTVHVSARMEATQLVIEVADDGNGLPQRIVPGYGIRNMRDRAGAIGAELMIAAPDGGGTVVTVQYDACARGTS